MTPAETLLKKIDGHDKIRISAEGAITDFANHLSWLMQRHVKKSYKKEYLVSWVFSTKQSFEKKSEADGYCRANLVVAKLCFDSLVNNIQGNHTKPQYKDLMRYHELVRDFIHDLKPIAEYLERQKNPTYTFFHGHKSYSVHTWEVFRISQQLAVQSAFRNQYLHFDHKTARIVSVFVLRQALEAKFFRLVAVEIYNKTGDTPRLKHLFHYDFIEKNNSYFDFKAVTFLILKKIYQWCNDIVHRVYLPLAWEVDYAQQICQGLFFPLKTPASTHWSINNAVEINKCDQMQSAFIDHFCSEYDHGIWACEPIKPEAMCI